MTSDSADFNAGKSEDGCTHASWPVVILLKGNHSPSLVANQVSESYCHSCSLAIRVRSFGIHLRLFCSLRSALLGCHFRNNKVVQLFVKYFLHSLGKNFSQECFLKLISRYDKYIDVGG
ncbi:hypothetical protein AVEN_166242-1 [Araneus ventricosus]|uniref:Uncharacterized protein n=1 Tax=Araneus ventricosus TaxID=182803 RepID=A0A4Y2D6L2_ARAVE|nr:hypothetical protein AVEN_166242-1 [Araneus ventricosus]